MANRGLYGQSESDAQLVNGEAQRFADVVSEGLMTSDGSYTEQGYRVRLGLEAAQEMAAAKGERKAEALVETPAFIRTIEVRGYRDDQRAALQRQADIAQEMDEAGFGHRNIMTALSMAAPLAFQRRELVASARRGTKSTKDKSLSFITRGAK